MNHTPGPWTVYDHYPCVSAENVDNLALCNDQSIPMNERIANARLIAAAPELLDVLKELQQSAAYWSEYDVPLGIVDRIRAVIAKATGGSHE